MATSGRLFFLITTITVFTIIVGLFTIWKGDVTMTNIRKQFNVLVTDDIDVKENVRNVAIKSVLTSPVLNDHTTLPSSTSGKRNQTPHGTNASSPTNFTAVILLTYMRSGSSLTGDILQQHEDAFYIFEPLRALKEFNQDRNKPLEFLNGTTRMPGSYNETEVNLMTIFGWLNCSFQHIHLQSLLAIEFLGFGKKSNNGGFDDKLHLNMKTHVFTQCLFEMEKSCEASTMRIIKTIRTPMHFMEKILSSIPGSKVVHLIRDPRATIASQSHRNVCPPETGGLSGCENRHCSCVMQDTSMKQMLTKRFSPNRIQTIFYEDIAKSPIETSRKMYTFLRIKFTPKIQNYVFNITLGDKTTGCTVCRLSWQLGRNANKNSRTHIDAWKTAFHPKYINDTQSYCKDVMKYYGYEHLNLTKSRQ